MITKLYTLRSLNRRRATGVSFVFRRHIHEDRCDAHMNELPVPCGPWGPWYRNKQRNYNRILWGGTLWFLFSLGMMLYTNSLFLNWGPPLNPGPPSEMIEECDCD